MPLRRARAQQSLGSSEFAAASSLVRSMTRCSSCSLSFFISRLACISFGFRGCPSYLGASLHVRKSAVFLNLEECRPELTTVESGFSCANGRLAHEVHSY